jgi:hypothetical protein
MGKQDTYPDQLGLQIQPQIDILKQEKQERINIRIFFIL